jgi:hypothetical protein
MDIGDLIPLGFAVIGGAIAYSNQSTRLNVAEGKLEDLRGIKTDVALILKDIQYIKERI